MAFCSQCGADVPDNAAFCTKCGHAMSAAMVVPAAAGGESGMAENVAGLLCYSLGWVTGLIFFFIDKRPFVRFHAAQSIVVFGGLQIVSIVLGEIFLSSLRMGGFVFFSFGGLLISAVRLLELVLWILLMVKAYQHEKYKVPVAAGIAESFAGK